MTDQPDTPDTPVDEDDSLDPWGHPENDGSEDAPEPPDPGEGDASTASVPLDLGDQDDEVVIEQQSVGAEDAEGGGEWPDPATPPSDAAPGPLAGPPPAPTQRPQFKEAQDSDRP